MSPPHNSANERKHAVHSYLNMQQFTSFAYFAYLPLCSYVSAMTASSQRRYENDGDKLPAKDSYRKKRKIFAMPSLIVLK